MIRILLVEDDPLVRETMSTVLHDCGFAIREAGDGACALRLLEREAIDVVITDIVMPDFDGIELLLAVRKRYPKVRVLCISGGGRTGNRQYLEVASKLGADMVLAKPFSPSQLCGAVHATLSVPITSRPPCEESACD